MSYSLAQTIPASKGTKMFGLKKIRHAFQDALYNVCGVATAEKRERVIKAGTFRDMMVDFLARNPDLLPPPIPMPTEREAMIMPRKVVLARLDASYDRMLLRSSVEHRRKRWGLVSTEDSLRPG